MFLEDELKEVQKLCHNRVANSKLTTCINGLVRVEIRKSPVKSLVAVLQFPQRYPQVPLIIELRSKTLAENLLTGLTQLCEKEAKKYLGRSQILKTLELVSEFLNTNPLCCCADEISRIKKELLCKDTDEIKLKQKISSLSLTLKEGLYVHRVSIFVPDDYPNTQVKLDLVESNFPGNLCRFFQAQATELARRCVESPLLKKNTNPSVPFEPRPSLFTTVSFLVQQIRRYPSEKCSICNVCCFPEIPSEIVEDEGQDLFIDRIYCGHLYHSGCLRSYMKIPPFRDGKKCVACKQRIFHDKYKLSPEVSESRWAHEQARQREIEEVIDFLT